MPADADNSRTRATHSTTKGDADALGVALGLAVGVALGLTDPLGVGDGLGLATGEALSDAVALLDGSGDGDAGGSTGALGSRAPVRVDNETVRSELVSALASTGGVTLSDADSDAEADAVGDADGLDDGIGDALSDGVTDTLGDTLGDGLKDGLGGADCDGSSSLGAHNFGISAGICHVSITSESVTSEVGVTGMASEDSAAWAGTRGAKSRSVAVEAAITRTARERRTDARMRFRVGCIEVVSHDDAQSKPS